jgi:hypothetical protein
MIYAKDNGAPAPENQGGVAGAFYPPAATVRDLEAEGVMQHLNPSKSVGMAEWSNATAMIDLQLRMKRLESDVVKLNGLVAALMAKQLVN